MTATAVPAPARRNIIAHLKKHAASPILVEDEVSPLLSDMYKTAAKNIIKGTKEGYDYPAMLERAKGDFAYFFTIISESSNYESPQKEFWEEIKRKLCPVMFFCSYYDFSRE